MKLFVVQKTVLNANARQRRVVGFTLVEMMVAMGIFGFVVFALMDNHIFGLKLDAMVGRKLGASDNSRVVFQKLLGEVHSATDVKVGSVSGNTFKPIALGLTQQGNAIQITNSTSYVCYYLAAGNDTVPVQEYDLWRTENRTFSNPQLVAQYIINSPPIFTIEDYTGATLTSYPGKYVVHISMQFNQYSYPVTQVGPGNYYDSYKLESRITPRP